MPTNLPYTSRTIESALPIAIVDLYATPRGMLCKPDSHKSEEVVLPAVLEPKSVRRSGSDRAASSSSSSAAGAVPTAAGEVPTAAGEVSSTAGEVASATFASQL